VIDNVLIRNILLILLILLTTSYRSLGLIIYWCCVMIYMILLYKWSFVEQSQWSLILLVVY